MGLAGGFFCLHVKSPHPENPDVIRLNAMITAMLPLARDPR
ncbi:hypothetical protein RISK_004352 [Rhodopirellula islandica]|uniref:Uncharacterized protein n=1 Tax=Rhodopirellula islandica TaxID=595434 RepID=A0A0J1BA66_RHOIS|nr:hypothetical protein RISK_004352 [Rhodopirellula islandica]